MSEMIQVPPSYPTPNISRVSPPDQSQVNAADLGPTFPLLVSFEMPFGAYQGPPEVSQPRLCLDGIDITDRSTKNGHEAAFDMYYEEGVSEGEHNAEVSYFDYRGQLVVYSWEFEAN